MTITVFQSDKGDCLLLRSRAGTNVLCDGGMRSSYDLHVAPHLGRLRERGEPLHLVYVSHIDQDHIAGVLKLFDDEVAWRVYDFQRAGGNAAFPVPGGPRPPEVHGLWHNAFRDQVGANDGRLEDLLVTAMKASLLVTDNEAPAEAYTDLVSSIREALLLRQRVSPQQLGVPVNGPAGGRLMFIGQHDGPLAVGGFRATVVGPLEAELGHLRDEWNAWLDENEGTVRRIRADAHRDAERMGADEGATLQAALLELGRHLGDRRNVTTPNLASLMLLVEEGDGPARRSVLLTGDGHADDVVEGLREAGRLGAEGRIHVDVLKVPHHGSEHNARPDFFRDVTANHYVFCGDGAHENPDPAIVEALIETRAATLDRPFTLWFNSSKAVATRADRGRHMQELERLVRRATVQYGGQLDAQFLTTGSALTLEL